MSRYARMNINNIDDIIMIEKKSFIKGWSKKMFIEELDNPLAHYFVIMEESNVVGYAGMWLILEEAHITNIAIHPNCQGRGYGKDLLRFIIRYAMENNIDKITLEVRTSNKKAIALYKSEGFEGTGLRKSYYSDNNEDALIMWRNLC